MENPKRKISLVIFAILSVLIIIPSSLAQPVVTVEVGLNIYSNFSVELDSLAVLDWYPSERGFIGDNEYINVSLITESGDQISSIEYIPIFKS